MRKTQLDFVRDELKNKGYITRNFCLKHYISRLGARINDLKREGMDIEGKNLKTDNGMDYIYHLKKPIQKTLF